VIVFDENIDQWLIDIFKGEGFDILSIREQSSGITDREVIEIAGKQKGVLVTEDKDFGELAFSHDLKNCSVILLRYHQSERREIASSVKKVLSYLDKTSDHFFFTVSKRKIRKRRM